MNWHNSISDFGSQIADRFSFPTSNLYFPVSPSAGLPLTSTASHPAMETQGPTAQLQNSLREGNEHQSGGFAS